MTGKHHVVAETARVRYSFDIIRNITVIQGDSATGKTTLIELLTEYKRRGSGQGITISSDVPCYVYSGDGTNWKYDLDIVKGSLVFIDEDYSFIFTKQFAEYLPQTDNYYIFITRKPLYNLPYSITEIYGIRTSGKFHFPEKIYNEFYPLYPIPAQNDVRKDVLILVEDKEAGYQFFSSLVGPDRCITSEGNSSLYKKILAADNTNGILAIADGAAFGAYIDKVVKFAELKMHIALYFPESFEWMVLKSGILKDASLDEIMRHPQDYIDSAEYVSWERFFTDLLKEKTKDDPVKRYSKKSLSSFYTGKNADQILSVMPPEIISLINM